MAMFEGDVMNKKMDREVINNYIKTYLIGPMEDVAKKDSGRGWRQRLTKEFDKRTGPNGYPIHVFDPTVEEEAKVGYETEEFHEKLNGWVLSGNEDKVKEGMGIIWKGKTYWEINPDTGIRELRHLMGDVDYVRHSNFLILYLEEGDKPCLHGNTLVTMADLSQKRIKDIKAGDRVLGVITKDRKTYYKPSEVLASYDKGLKKTVKLNQNNLICTPDHEFLVASKKGAGIYKTIKKINDNQLEIWKPGYTELDKDFYKGWVCGYFTHDAHIRSRKTGVEINIVSDKKEEIIKVKTILEKLNITNIKISEKTGTDKRYPLSTIYSLNIYNKKDFNKIQKILKSKDNNQFKKGWITGAIDADGWYDKYDLRYSQSNVNIDNYLKFKQYLCDLNVPYTSSSRKRKTNFSHKENIDLFCRITKNYCFIFPSQLDYKRKINNKTLNGTKKDKVKINKTGIHKVYDITTTTGNFIANGIITHNCGTYGEAFLAYLENTPIYLIRSMPKSSYSKTLLGWIYGSGGAIFPNQSQLMDFLDEKYGLKLKEEENEK